MYITMCACVCVCPVAFYSCVFLSSASLHAIVWTYWFSRAPSEHFHSIKTMTEPAVYGPFHWPDVKACRWSSLPVNCTFVPCMNSRSSALEVINAWDACSALLMSLYKVTSEGLFSSWTKTQSDISPPSHFIFARPLFTCVIFPSYAFFHTLSDPNNPMKCTAIDTEIAQALE